MINEFIQTKLQIMRPFLAVICIINFLRIPYAEGTLIYVPCLKTPESTARYQTAMCLKDWVLITDHVMNIAAMTKTKSLQRPCQPKDGSVPLFNTVIV